MHLEVPSVKESNIDLHSQSHKSSIKEYNQKKDRSFTKGAILINISVLAMALQTLFSKLLLLKYKEDMTPVELYALRQILTMFLWASCVNINLKHFLYDLVSFSDLKPLVLRSVFGTANTYYNVQNVEFFPLTIVGISLNLVPICTSVIAAIFLGETMSSLNVVRLIIGFIGVVIIMEGFSHTSQGEDSPWYSYFGLAIVPIGMATSTVLMRKMKKVNFVAKGIYNYTFQLPLILVYFGLYVQFNWSLFSKFTIEDYLLIFGAAVGQQAYSIFKMFATKYINASQVAPFQYLVIMYQLFFDLVIFDLSFGILIWSGLAVMIIGYGGTVAYDKMGAKKADDNFTRMK